ncbi:uncharacterized protein LOC126833017 [Adelges cooleyi]|uniref:uncharacterized protein LOC126833017 n=1 Tax=Adelges cooleyi TaxID=133065 RepID=UPI00217F2737|nr:uncharacterized protein LOC126833017 [Adelges cooleyi]
MFFKLSILFLTFIIIDNSVLGLTEDEALKEAYYTALEHFEVPLGQGLTASNMRDFLGSTIVPSVMELPKSVRVENLDNIDLNLFKNIMQVFCQKNQLNPTDFLQTQNGIGNNKKQRLS